jgi:CRP/FNR family transcriptional regulator, cyclic AMP receptor protein
MGWEVLERISEEQRRLVLAATVRRRYRKGQVLFHEGDAGDTFHLLDRGRVAVRVSTPMGDVATLTVLGPGDSFGELALVGDGAVRTATVEALEPVETLTLRRAALEDVCRRHPSVQAVMTKVLARTVERLSSQVLELLYLPAEQRVLRRLSELAELWAAGGEMEVPITQEVLASMAGTTRSTANKALREMAERGVLSLRRGRVVVHDPVALARAAR